MQRTAPGLRTDPASRLADLERRRPEWRIWLGLLDVVEQAVASHEPVAGRKTPVVRRQSPDAGSADWPLLHGTTLDLDGGQVHRILRRLLSIAASGELAGGATLRGYNPTKAEAVTLVMDAVMQRKHGIRSLAQAAGIDGDALGSVAHLAALPLLRSCGELLENRVPGFWPHGYCPVCAAWPTLAERRGLDRTRRMRCGRCGGEWEMQWLSCVYCGERDHEKLGSLIPEGSGETLKVETCASCRGYLKSLATLQAIPSPELLLRDLDTVELDLVALDRDYGRPEEPGFTLEIEVK